MVGNGNTLAPFYQRPYLASAIIDGLQPLNTIIAPENDPDASVQTRL
jgi:hypothetical protein